MSAWRRFVWLLGNPYFAIFFLAVMFSGLAIYLSNIWAPIFSIVISCLIADIISPLFLRGGGGITQITMLGNQTQRRGYAFIVFVVFLMIVGTIITETLTVQLTTLLNTDIVSALIEINVVLIIVSYLDFLHIFAKR